ncbi:uncharacterized protein B0P05DRAFT_585631 [Gilbertella persicaria]|uniref:uncharacterized protein n=1 Tax=Gilbertella persicaria TaxID=101096 RepID=UPI0022211EA2|nr:uncharacterized protein B0P05DRAFT_585631 [Gilbertella persicaria]KAI8084343.1 hypothetical protein B0P05DRAFT_585631 [Gilbertella persicaria]
MCDLNWCPVCDSAISCESDSLYCSIDCYRQDASEHLGHQILPLLPKTPSVTLLKPESMDHVPELTRSIYTSSSISIQSLQKKLLYYGEEEEEEECCLYCEKLKKEQETHKPNPIPIFLK